MTHVILLVSNLELTVSQIVKSIWLVMIFFGLLVNIRSLLRSDLRRSVLLRIGFSLILLAMIFPVVKWLRIDGAMLNSDYHVEGKTLGMCQVFLRGKGIAFEYEIQGKRYWGCDTYHPLNLEDIVIQNGYYLVRYSEKFHDRGRMDFNKPVN